jgi:hypothetical protein
MTPFISSSLMGICASQPEMDRTGSIIGADSILDSTTLIPPLKTNPMAAKYQSKYQITFRGWAIITLIMRI